MSDGDGVACDLCGATRAGADPRWSLDRDGARVRWLCPECVRRHVRDIEAKLPHDWW